MASVSHPSEEELTTELEQAAKKTIQEAKRLCLEAHKALLPEPGSSLLPRTLKRLGEQMLNASDEISAQPALRDSGEELNEAKRHASLALRALRRSLFVRIFGQRHLDRMPAYLTSPQFKGLTIAMLLATGVSCCIPADRPELQVSAFCTAGLRRTFKCPYGDDMQRWKLNVLTTAHVDDWRECVCDPPRAGGGCNETDADMCNAGGVGPYWRYYKDLSTEEKEGKVCGTLAKFKWMGRFPTRRERQQCDELLPRPWWPVALMVTNWALLVLVVAVASALYLRERRRDAKLLKATVRIGLYDRTRGRFFDMASGAVVSNEGHILTCAHALIGQPCPPRVGREPLMIKRDLLPPEGVALPPGVSLQGKVATEYEWKVLREPPYGRPVQHGPVVVATESHPPEDVIVVIGLYQGPNLPCKWTFKASLVGDLDGGKYTLLKEQLKVDDGSSFLLDLAVLRVNGIVELDPPVFGDAHSLATEYRVFNERDLSEGDKTQRKLFGMLGRARIAREWPEPIPINDEQIAEGSELAAAGWPSPNSQAGGQRVLHIHRDVCISSDRGHVRSKAWIHAGSSGGPCVNGRSELIGIASFNSALGLSYFRSVRELRPNDNHPDDHHGLPETLYRTRRRNRAGEGSRSTPLDYLELSAYELHLDGINLSVDASTLTYSVSGGAGTISPIGTADPDALDAMLCPVALRGGVTHVAFANPSEAEEDAPSTLEHTRVAGLLAGGGFLYLRQLEWGGGGGLSAERESRASYAVVGAKVMGRRNNENSLRFSAPVALRRAGHGLSRADLEKSGCLVHVTFDALCNMGIEKFAFLPPGRPHGRRTGFAYVYAEEFERHDCVFWLEPTRESFVPLAPLVRRSSSHAPERQTSGSSSRRGAKSPTLAVRRSSSTAMQI